MPSIKPRRTGYYAALAVTSAGAALLAGCGGGGGSVGSTPPPVASTPTPSPPDPAPTPSPSPSPTPTPTSTGGTFDTAEYRQSDGPQFHRAIPAWQAGATGSSVTLAIVDTGIDRTNPEFSGRISSASADVAGSRSIQEEDDHGTQVALIAAAARNNTGIMGVAYNATIQVLRADTVGSCATFSSSNPDSGCSFSDNALAAGVDKAVSAGARVINLSVGGSTINSTLRDSIGRAAAAGVVIVVAAGNGGDSTDPAVDPNQPDPFASSVLQAGTGKVIIAGSVNMAGTISSFSNRAGNSAAYYLNGLGEDVCCVYQNGVLKVTTDSSGQRFVTVVSGTSFSAPQISGAVALVAQAFPNMSGAQIVDLLLRTARDAGAAGTDSIYGRGILDIANAFSPQGTTSLAGGTSMLPLGDDTAVTSAAMGDAQGTLGAIILDGYARAFAVDLAQSVHHAQAAQRLTPALSAQVRHIAAGNRDLALAFTIDARHPQNWIAPLRLTAGEAQQARVLAASITGKVGEGRQLGFAYGQGADELASRLAARRQPAFLVAEAPGEDFGFAQADRTSLALRQALGGVGSGLGLTISAETGDALTAPAHFAESLRSRRQQETMSRFGVTLDAQHGALDGALGASWLREDRTVLGARFHDALAGGGADSAFVDARIGYAIAPDLRLGAAWRGGLTVPDRSGAITGGSRLLSQAFAADLEKVGVLQRNDRLALRIAQPLRVESGGVAFNLPVAYDYATLATTYGTRFMPLTPQGRELMGELAWRGTLWGGDAAASVYYRKDPGHYASLPDDKGVAVKWATGF
ncbi:S8 family serine peptidase [Novosphingobium tardum]|uniref:S8 family serine peptidase n=1 Tax=Novosphingobium tardum TaxID=1538021 RepID=A0ABV8RTS6_9SPHN